MTRSFRYVGDDTFHGVPQRDLTPDDFATLSPKRQSLVLASASYWRRTIEATGADRSPMGGEASRPHLDEPVRSAAHPR